MSTSSPVASSVAPAVMIRRWYRSRLCWIGLPGLLFLFWAWADSNRQVFLLRRADLTSEAAFFHWGGGLSVSRASSLANEDLIGFSFSSRMLQPMGAPGFSRFVVPAWSFSRKAFPASATTNHSPGFWRSPTPSGGSSWTLLLPYWLLILCYLALWIAGMAFWQRRKCRLLIAPAVLVSPPP